MADPAAVSSSTIVVGYSATPEGAAALQRAITEAALRNCSLVVVHTCPPSEIEPLKSTLAASGLAHQIREAANSLEPAEDVLSAADDTKADFIVIGLRRRSPVGKLLLGSNAQRVLLDASCPVLAVKAES